MFWWYPGRRKTEAGEPWGSTAKASTRHHQNTLSVPGPGALTPVEANTGVGPVSPTLRVFWPQAARAALR